TDHHGCVRTVDESTDVPRARRGGTGRSGAERAARAAGVGSGANAGAIVARSRRPARLSGESETGDLPLPSRRAVASRDVRLQAETRRNERHTDARVADPGTTNRATAGAAAHLPGSDARVQAIRRIGTTGLRAFSGHRRPRPS